MNVAPILACDKALMLQQLTMLFGRAISGLVEITAIKAALKEDGFHPRTRYFQPDQLDEAVDWAAQVNADHMWNVYVGAALRREDVDQKNAASDPDFLRTYAIWADADDEEQVERARTLYQKHKLQPPFVVVTGRTPTRRAQLWWPLETPIDDIAILRATVRGIADALGTDHAVLTGKQLMRLAGSLSWPKPNKPGRVLELTELICPVTAQREFPVEQIHRAFPPVERSDMSSSDLHDIELTRTSALGLNEKITDGREAWTFRYLRAKLRELVGTSGQDPDAQGLYDAAAAYFFERVGQDRPGRGPGFLKQKCVEAVRAYHLGQIPGMGSLDEAMVSWATSRVAAAEASTPEPAVAVSGALLPVLNPWERYIVPPFPLDCLPPILSRFVEYQAASIGADRSGIALAALVACSGAISHDFRLKMARTGDWHVRPRLWGLLVGESSNRKTPIMGAAMAPLMDRDGDAAEAYARAHAQWQEAYENKEAAKRDEPGKPPRHVVQDTTVEKLSEILSRSDRGTLSYRDELSGWIGSMDKYSGGGKAGSADRAHWLKAYDGGRYTVDRIKGETTLSNFSVSFLGGIQPDKLTEMGNLTADGLLQRFLPVMLGKPALPEEVENDAPVTEYTRLIHFLAESRAVRILCDTGAHAVTKRLQARIHDMEQSQVFGKALTSFLGKLPGVYGSLMLVLHLVEDPEHGRELAVEHRTAEVAERIIFDFIVPQAMEFYRFVDDKTDGETLRQVAGFVLTSDLTRFRASDFTANIHALRLPLWELQRKLSVLVTGGWLRPEDNSPTCRAWLVEDGVRERFAAETVAETARRAQVRAYMTKFQGGQK